GGASRFYLLHRPRRFNANDRVWMGWERKRGKLAELAHLLRLGDPAAFSRVEGDLAHLPRCDYVITLDSDTLLPRDSARLMVATMAHPLNRPVHDPATGLVVRGYGILQPRVAISLASARRSWFARIFTGDPGIDPYTRAVSDVYQDLFGEGSYVGKGIYDVAAFERALAGRLPENRILSHDLLEGCHARAGLVSDVLLVEDQPTRYLVDQQRRHRWMRGDWQIAHWTLPWVRDGAGRRTRNPLSVLSRWKLFDNLRRSLVAPAAVALIAAAPFIAGPAWPWLALVVLMLAMPLLVALVTSWGSPGPDVPRGIVWMRAIEGLGKQLVQVAIGLAMLPFEAAQALDAVLRTWWRLIVSGRHLLEWRTSSEAERAHGDGIIGTWFGMRWAPALAIASATAAAVTHRPEFVLVAPLHALWFCAPTLAWWLSRAVGDRPVSLDHDERVFLRRAARRTWSFFEAFVNRGEHWLPPDNYQEHPTAVVAHRTSPTNIGLSLLANQAAWDFGWLPLRGVIQRTQGPLLTMDSLERYRGHFYNWYDTRTLKPLPPLYVSTVDSGNLAAHLLTARGGLLMLADQPLMRAAAYAGLADTLGLCATRLDALDDDGLRPVREDLRLALASLGQPQASLGQAVTLFADLAKRWAAIAAREAVRADAELARWADASARQASAWHEELTFFAPWIEAAAPREADWRAGLITAGELIELRAAYDRLDQGPTLRAIAALRETMLPALDRLLGGRASPAAGDGDNDRIFELRRRIVDAAVRAEQAIGALEELAQQCHDLADMDFAFLYDKGRDLFTIGFNVTDHRLDGSFYDLLASEARLASFLAIAQGQVRQEHWFSLGRMMTVSHGRPALLSWSGSMFEYLMPNLVMPTHADTVLDQTNRSAVERQIEYGRHRGVPWGISESGYHLTDVHLNYQYRAFGVPGMGLKRGLGEDLVIAPYASAMAVMIAPRAAVKNLQRLQAEGREGQYGFYEAIDYTPARLPRGATAAPVRSWMAHHQGMALLAIDAVINDWPMQRRFMSDPIFKSVDLLLQERVPHAVAPVFPHATESGAARRAVMISGDTLRVFTTPNPQAPEIDLLSNGRYHVLIGAAGGGASRWRDLMVLRWREDAVREAHGLFCYIRDRGTGQFWSNASMPTLRPTRHYEAIFTQARAEFRRRDHDLDAHTEIAVSPEDDVEIRRITVTNRSRETRTIEFTSFGEVAMAPLAADAAHPAFSNLFVQTQILHASQAIVCTRRPRQAGEKPPYLVHAMALHGVEDGTASFETDRSAFVGRWRSIAEPRAMDHEQLGGAEGSPLDPIISVRRCVRLEPDQSATIDLMLGMAETREAAVALIDKYRERRLADRVFDLAWTHGQVVLRQLNVSEPLAQAFAHIAGAIVHPTAHRRAGAAIIGQNRRGQNALWGYGISGDHPIVLLKVGDAEKLELVKQAVQAHAWWRSKGLVVDLVIMNEDPSVYRAALYDLIVGLVAAGPEAGLIDKPGGIFVRRADQIGEEDRILIQTLARVILTDSLG
ncbi:MAG: cyclic beta 1-2 glucan synthetase, partial [Planctomycetes bacterium]|nr:cyclic beta 1-2 glucan synthetase [Planctomycetota bacterium]